MPSDPLHSAATDAATIQTAEEFARDQEAKAVARAAARAHELQVKRLQARVSIVLAAVWAPVVVALIAGISFLVWQVTTQHTQRDHDQAQLKARQVSVWCYADPNSSRATSHFTGLRADLVGICPEGYR